MLAYCLKQKKMVEMKDMKNVVLKNGRHAVSGICSECGTKMFKFVKK